MFEFKLQLGCLIVVLYITVIYVKNTLDKQFTCNRYFDALLVISPWAIIFDGVTAWTVNHMDIVPDWLNLLFHGLFLISMNVLLSLIFVYMMNQTVGIRNKKQLALYMLPGALVTLFILCSLDKLYYIHGETTNYSYGAAVIACYLSLFVHFAMILILIYTKRRTLEKKKRSSIVSFLLLSLCLLIAQVLLPEILISAVVPMITIIGIYVNFEDPSLRRLHCYNANMVTGFATLVENRDNSTGGHIRRTQGYVQILLDEVQRQPIYYRSVTKDYIRNVVDAAPMHDIGKISTPDYILQKPGKLTDEEYAIMKQHAAVGGDIIKETFASLDHPEYLQIAYEMARFHHEKWNGKGYPDGLKGREIPLHARIMAIADVFDAVSSKRCYRDPMPVETCFQIIQNGAGTDFDPDLVELFMNAKDKVLVYYEQDKEVASGE